ncbi:hypothetical protein RJ639_033752 [Escallonia herrerae]|uniref:RING-type domain-containing protein n=1 Tax=Escallonia herrerae TaxID=1293975 RepID=A0AA88WTC9_9ASTE|nr:hypothetical protein RJ639_033752 [Escallonia herrerae]
MASSWVFFCRLLLLVLVPSAFANVVLIGNNVTLSFDGIEANFGESPNLGFLLETGYRCINPAGFEVLDVSSNKAPSVKGSGVCGMLYVAEPLDACSPLTKKAGVAKDGVPSPFALIIRGSCSFEDKVRRAQAAGFKAAIVYDDEDGDLVAMAGNSAGIKIHSVFVSKASGQALTKYAGMANMEAWIIPSFANSAWSIMAISFISLLAMSAVLATCFFVRRHRIRRERPRASHVREFHGMSSRLVKAMPSLIFTAVLEDNCTSTTCAICLEDYNVGEKLRILPCRHKFHAVCVDAWLTSWRTFCPVCKRDARTNMGDPPASECTPLLSSSPASIASSSILSSSARSSVASSSAIRIAPASSRSPSVPLHHSVSSTSYNHQSLQSYRQSPYLSLSRSSVDLRNASSQRSRASHMVSSNSLGYPSVSPFNSRYMSLYNPSPGNPLSSYIGSSSQLRLHYSESTTSFSPYASAHSLPGVE